MNWTKAGWNLETSGDYAVTGHAAKDGGAFYIAWWGKSALSSTCETKEAAREVCRQHAGKRQ